MAHANLILSSIDQGINTRCLINQQNHMVTTHQPLKYDIDMQIFQLVFLKQHLDNLDRLKHKNPILIHGPMWAL